MLRRLSANYSDYANHVSRWSVLPTLFQSGLFMPILFEVLLDIAIMLPIRSTTSGVPRLIKA